MNKILIGFIRTLYKLIKFAVNGFVLCLFGVFLTNFALTGLSSSINLATDPLYPFPDRLSPLTFNIFSVLIPILIGYGEHKLIKFLRNSK